MKITNVKRLKKSLVQLYIDGEEAVQIDKEVFMLSSFDIGSEIDDEELYELMKTSDYQRAKERALYYLERKNYSKKDLTSKIMQFYSKETATEVTKKMEDLGFINDENYAQMYARDLFNLKKYGKQRVKTELYRKGIDKEIIAQILDEEEVESGDNIATFLSRKYALWQEDEKVKRRAVNALQRRGYSFSEIFKAMREMEEDY